MSGRELYASAFVLTVREGMTGEYRRRHAEVWPEMLAALKASGIVRYDIYLDEAGRRVFGYQLRSRPADPSAPEDPVILRWRAYMADVLEMDGDKPQRTPVENVSTTLPK